MNVHGTAGGAQSTTGAPCAPDPPIAVIVPFRAKVEDDDATPAIAVSLAFSEVNSPVVSTVNANTAATTTKAISTIAVSNPVIPLRSVKNSRKSVRLGILSFKSISTFIGYFLTRTVQI